MKRALLTVLVAAVLGSSPAHAKRLGFSTPSRTIYDQTEKFSTTLDQNRRKWVVEVALGSGPEGNLGVTLGYLLNIPQGFELYAGLGTRSGPVQHSSAAFRYFLPFLRYRGYVGGGYIFQSHSRIGLWSHSTFGEAGFKWILGHTFHMTLSVGAQRILHHTVRDGVLTGPDIDPDRLDEQLDSIAKWRPMAALRFSRAF